jgi:Ca2+/H+ antiporter
MFSFASGVQLTGAALYGSVVTDLLLMLGVGLLIGRNIRVVRRYRGIQWGKESIPSLPQ